MQDALLRLRYRYWPDHLLGEILSKRWTETAIPVIVLMIITILLSRAIPGFLSVGGLADTGRQAGEIGFVVLGMALVVIVGGIDLSVGSMFALCDFCALFCLNVLDWPVPAVIVATIACGAALGAVNGLLISGCSTIRTKSRPPSLTFRPGTSSAAAWSWAYQAWCWSTLPLPYSGTSF